MIELSGNIWDYHSEGSWITITTNGTVKKNGECVMGRGIALQTREKFPLFPLFLGAKILESGNHVHFWEDYRLVTFPVKHNWWEKADSELIRRSAEELVGSWLVEETLYLVRPGCANGQLNWAEVKPIIGPILDDRFVIVDWA